MSYTLNLIQAGVNAVVPFADKIPGMENNAPEKISKKQEEMRLKVARSMQKAIQEGRLSPSYASAVANMEEKAQTNTSEANYSNAQYGLDQLGKLSPILNVVIPGSGIVAKTAAQLGTVQNLKRYAEEAPSTKDTLIKTAKFAGPILAGFTAPFWMPYVTTTVIATGAAAILCTTLTLDGLSYYRG